MEAGQLYARYQELQAYLNWDLSDAERVQRLGPLLSSSYHSLIDDFYEEIERHPAARAVITGGDAQIARLKQTLRTWVHELLSGPYDEAYVVRRWKVGRRHVEIGLDQIYTNVALSRLHHGLLATLGKVWKGNQEDLFATMRSLNKLVDLDLAIIEDAYQAEYVARHQRDERLATIGQMAGGIAHELRNPLNVVRTSVYYLLNARNPPAEKIAEHLRRVDQHVLLADGVITALSNFAKMPVPQFHPFSIEQCVREALETNPLPGAIETNLDFPASLPPALGDKDQIRIVFANLIRNARDAMPQGGKLEINASVVGNLMEVVVRDSGAGIPAEILSRIMEPLYSTKARGLGLGLALARAILEKSKGSLTVTSELGKGSTFIARLAAEPK